MPYIELLGDYWGELCVTPEMASRWADEFIPVLEGVWNPKASGHGYFKGASACLASMCAAGRHQELLALIDKPPFKWWHDRRWGVQALSAMGKKAEAIRYAEESRSLNDPVWQIAQACETILLSSGLADEVYRRHALEANQGTTNLAMHNPTDPRTLTSAARQFVDGNDPRPSSVELTGICFSQQPAPVRTSETHSRCRRQSIRPPARRSPCGGGSTTAMPRSLRTSGLFLETRPERGLARRERHVA